MTSVTWRPDIQPALCRKEDGVSLELTLDPIATEILPEELSLSSETPRGHREPARRSIPSPLPSVRTRTAHDSIEDMTPDQLSYDAPPSDLLLAALAYTRAKIGIDRQVNTDLRIASGKATDDPSRMAAIETAGTTRCCAELVARSLSHLFANWQDQRYRWQLSTLVPDLSYDDLYTMQWSGALPSALYQKVLGAVVECRSRRARWNETNIVGEAALQRVLQQYVDAFADPARRGAYEENNELFLAENREESRGCQEYKQETERIVRDLSATQTQADSQALQELDHEHMSEFIHLFDRVREHVNDSGEATDLRGALETTRIDYDRESWVTLKRYLERRKPEAGRDTGGSAGQTLAEEEVVEEQAEMRHRLSKVKKSKRSRGKKISKQGATAVDLESRSEGERVDDGSTARSQDGVDLKLLVQSETMPQSELIDFAQDSKAAQKQVRRSRRSTKHTSASRGGFDKEDTMDPLSTDTTTGTLPMQDTEAGTYGDECRQVRADLAHKTAPAEGESSKRDRKSKQSKQTQEDFDWMKQEPRNDDSHRSLKKHTKHKKPRSHAGKTKQPKRTDADAGQEEESVQPSLDQGAASEHPLREASDKWHNFTSLDTDIDTDDTSGFMPVRSRQSRRAERLTRQNTVTSRSDLHARIEQQDAYGTRRGVRREERERDAYTTAGDLETERLQPDAYTIRVVPRRQAKQGRGPMRSGADVPPEDSMSGTDACTQQTLRDFSGRSQRTYADALTSATGEVVISTKADAEGADNQQELHPSPDPQVSSESVGPSPTNMSYPFDPALGAFLYGPFTDAQEAWHRQQEERIYESTKNAPLADRLARGGMLNKNASENEEEEEICATHRAEPLRRRRSFTERRTTRWKVSA